MKKILPVALFALIPFTGCSKSEPAPAEKPAAAPAKEAPAQPTKEAAAEPAKEAAAEPAKEGAAATDVQELTIESVDNQMAYNKKELKVKAGGTVKITLVNKATSEAMKHNIVIVKKGTSMKVGQAAISTMGVPPKTADVIAASDIAGPGKTVTVTFPTPAAGEYEFVCTFWPLRHDEGCVHRLIKRDNRITILKRHLRWRFFLQKTWCRPPPLLKEGHRDEHVIPSR